MDSPERHEPRFENQAPRSHEVMTSPKLPTQATLLFRYTGFDLFEVEHLTELSPLFFVWPVMGAGGLSGELRDHSEHVDAILRSRFQVNGPRSPEWQANDSRYSTHFTFPGDVLEEMPCADCTSNFSLFRRKVSAKKVPEIRRTCVFALQLSRLRIQMVALRRRRNLCTAPYISSSS